MSHGTELDVMVFNIWHGGRLDKVWTGEEFAVVHPHGFEERNQAELLDFLARTRPDVLFMVETYGLGSAVTAALNRDSGDDRVFRGIPITREAGQAHHRDNLWLFTWLEVDEVYPVISQPPVTSFNFGGARLTLPGGGQLHAFTTWLSHLEDSWGPVNQSAMEPALGVERTRHSEDLIAADHPRRLDMARTILTERLPHLVTDDAPVLLGGDFNTQSPLDWSGELATTPGREGLALDWPVMQMFLDAGFVDTFRAVNPDAVRHPGRTWAPGHALLYAPVRLDYLLARGEVEVLASATWARRLPDHRGSDLDELYPFYSDHGAVVSRLRVPSSGPGYQPAHPPAVEPPATTWPAVPPAPEGRRVPAVELSAQASTAEAGRGASLAVDADPRTSWISQMTPAPPAAFPHHLTIDLGAVRTLTAVRYQPPIDHYEGIIIGYSYAISTDGQHFEQVAAGTWARDSLPEDVLLAGVTGRYLRLSAHSGVAGYAAAAEVIPYVGD